LTFYNLLFATPSPKLAVVVVVVVAVQSAFKTESAEETVTWGGSSSTAMWRTLPSSYRHQRGVYFDAEQE
jgi:hypothetical protein